jgi:hypothetical protein
MLDTLECPVCPELATDCRKLLQEFRNKTTDRDFDIALCKIAVKHKACIEDMRWRPEPSMPPDYGKYMGMSFKDRNIFLDQNHQFLTIGKVADYLNNRDMIRNKNKRNMDALLLWLKLPLVVDEAPGLTEDEHKVVEVQLNTFSGRMK